MKKPIICILFILAVCGLTQAVETSPFYFGVNPGALDQVKDRLAGGDQSLQPALNRLLREADLALKTKPSSVMDKIRTPPSGDKHDYLSLPPYWWPDPASSNGLPYIRHDGKVNPECRDDALTDRVRIKVMRETMETLALAYYFTGNEDYATHAAKCLRTWFLDPATRMNPNLNFAQGIPGVNSGRGAGVLDGTSIAAAADAAGLFSGSAAWTQSDSDALKAWLKTYLDWLLTSENGRDEAASRNNHGTFYDIQVMRLALILGRTDLARQIAEAAAQKRIAVQIEPDGRQPLELERTAALGYSLVNLNGLFQLATLGGDVGVDLWHCRLPGGGNALSAALDFLSPYLANPPKPWPYQQIRDYEKADSHPLFRQAALVYREPKYEQLLSGFPDVSSERLQLLYPIASVPLDVAAIDRERILKAATAALAQEPVTITKFRAKLSEGGPNDFYSNGDYWWPNPKTTNGLPYINRDGQTNPDNFVAHRQVVRQMGDAVAVLGAAYKISGDDKYAAKAAELLRVFFLDENTRMNPNLQYAQAVPGVSPGRGTGIIDTLHLVEIPKAIEAMKQSPAFPPEVLAGMEKWFADYVAWMTTSKNGLEEANSLNNHAVAFWLQVAVFADFNRDQANLAECRRRFTEVFVPKQMTNDGGFPRELARTKPYGYSIFQLDNMVTLCQVLSTKENDLWNFALPDGRRIRRAVEFLYPFLADKSKWPRKPDVNAWGAWPARQPHLLFAGLAFGEPKYLDLWRKLPADPVNEEVRRNIAITQPVLWVETASPSGSASKP